MAWLKQCKLKEVGGDRETIGWIEMRGAKDAAHVEMKDFAGVRFEVVEVYEPALEATKLSEKQRMDRDCFGSIAGNK